MAEGKIFIHNHPVNYAVSPTDGQDDRVSDGIHHLTQMDPAVANTIFKQAEDNGQAEFQDQRGRAYIIQHRHDGGYDLSGRE